ncbi:hypothetical protein Cme02nite_37950 [Catellatospora methionotrophica]|uniref:Uncharacterized protein n=1 Tax=Catellatospora methionotrophica TaxID=121620 RepID=A0A8J3LC64_9ACTN|nr:hypothetical protein [Catellatospora methionotrophica]GIG15463.1 hypothetical protein Cme02nite_37950 [Catellatospora methionotrophica]
MNPRQKLGAPHATVTAGNAEVVRRGNQVTITGTPTAVGKVLDEMKSEGRLAWFEGPARTQTPGRVTVNAGLVRQRPSARTVAAVAGGGAVVLGGVGWAVYEVVTAIVEHAAVIIGGLLVVVVVLVVVGKAAGGGTFSGTFQGRMD